MTEVRIRNVDDWVVEWHRQSAKHSGQTLESHLRDTLTNIVMERKRAIAKEMRDAAEELRQKYGEFPDSTPFLREERDR